MKREMARSAAIAVSCASLLTITGCGDSDENQDAAIAVDITKLDQLGQHLSEGMEATESGRGFVDEEDILNQKDTYQSFESAQVSPPECASTIRNGDPSPAGTETAFYSVLYGDTSATIVVSERPESQPEDIDFKVKCAQAVVIGDGFSTAATKNVSTDQQFKFDGIQSLDLVTTIKQDDGTRTLSYGYSGWWDERHYFKMDVRLYSLFPGKVNPAPDVYPALELLNKAVRLVQGEEV